MSNTGTPLAVDESTLLQAAVLVSRPELLSAWRNTMLRLIANGEFSDEKARALVENTAALATEVADLRMAQAAQHELMRRVETATRGITKAANTHERVVELQRRGEMPPGVTARDLCANVQDDLAGEYA